MSYVSVNNFQSESSASGNEFEDAVALELSEIYNLEDGEVFQKVTLPELGIELDYLVLTEDGLECGEAKGGKPGLKKRPGAQRTDNVKKAICNGALLTNVFPGIKYVVYFSSPPKPGYASEAMLNIALEAGFVSEIRYLNIYTDNK